MKALQDAGSRASHLLDTRGRPADLRGVIHETESHRPGARPAALRRVLLGALVALVPTGAALAVAAVLASGCSNSGLLAPVPDSASEATLSDYRSAPLGSPSAFDVLSGLPIRTEVTSGWDFLFYVTPGGTMQLRPRDMVVGGTSGQGLQKVTQSFTGLTEAPSSGYVTDKAVAVTTGDVLAVVSRSDPNYSVQCRYYMKMKVLSINKTAGTLTFRWLANPNCEQRLLVPGQTGG